MQFKTLYSIFSSISIVKKQCMSCSFPLLLAPCRINWLLTHKLSDIDFFMRPIGPLQKITLPQKTRTLTFRYHWLMPWSFEIPFFHLEQIDKLRKSQYRRKTLVKVAETQQFPFNQAFYFWPRSFVLYNFRCVLMCLLNRDKLKVWEILKWTKSLNRYSYWIFPVNRFG